mmetsp:Transcript_92433/g.160204  ORF Transcript_92433/g.160204 Transcript_92433/m.160204 type:complete len:122 (-) Transcript_92433:330-695(-)
MSHKTGTLGLPRGIAQILTPRLSVSMFAPGPEFCPSQVDTLLRDRSGGSPLAVIASPLEAGKKGGIKHAVGQPCSCGHGHDGRSPLGLMEWQAGSGPGHCTAHGPHTYPRPPQPHLSFGGN